MNLLKKEKLILAVLLTALLLPGLAQAIDLEGAFYTAAGGVVGRVVLIINYIVGFIGGVIFSLGGFLIQAGLKLNANVTSAPIVRAGWLIVRDFANLGFVLAIIFIAISTIIRYQTPNTKKMIVNLIVMALLVNFSLTIAGILVDASGIVSNFFITKATTGLGDSHHEFAVNLANTFQIQRLTQVQDLFDKPFEDISGLQEFGSAMVVVLSSLFFVALFTVISAIVMMMIAALILVRYIALVILLIIMPLVWVAYVFPDFQGMWKKWWSAFMKWIMFLPASLFFLYLAILMVANFRPEFGSTQSIASEISNNGLMADFGLIIKNPFQTFTEMIVILGILIGGQIVASKFGLEMTSGIFKLSTSAREWALGKAKGAADVRRSPILQGIGQRLRGAAQTTAETAAGIPGLRGAGIAWEQSLSQSGRDAVEEFRERYFKNVSDNTVINYPEFGRSPEAQAAKVLELAERGKLDEYLQGLSEGGRRKALKRFTAAAEKMGVSNNLLNLKPSLAQYFGKSESEVVPKIKPTDITRIAKADFGDINVVTAMTEAQKNEISKSASDGVKKIVKETIEKELAKIKTEKGLTDDDVYKFAKVTQKQVEQQAKKQGITMERALQDIKDKMQQIVQQKQLSDVETKRLKSLAGFYKHINISPGWQGLS